MTSWNHWRNSITAIEYGNLRRGHSVAVRNRVRCSESDTNPKHRRNAGSSRSRRSTHGDGINSYGHPGSNCNTFSYHHAGADGYTTANSHTHTATDLYQTPDGDSKAHGDTTTNAETDRYAVYC